MAPRLAEANGLARRDRTPPCRPVGGLLLGVHDAQDAWSETFLAALRTYLDLPANANTEAWLVTIAHRKAIDVLRARERQPAPVRELPDAPTGLGIPGPGDCATDAARRAAADGVKNLRKNYPGAASEGAPA